MLSFSETASKKAVASTVKDNHQLKGSEKHEIFSQFVSLNVRSCLKANPRSQLIGTVEAHSSEILRKFTSRHKFTSRIDEIICYWNYAWNDSISNNTGISANNNQRLRLSSPSSSLTQPYKISIVIFVISFRETKQTPKQMRSHWIIRLSFDAFFVFCRFKV